MLISRKLQFSLIFFVLTVVIVMQMFQRNDTSGPNVPKQGLFIFTNNIQEVLTRVWIYRCITAY